MTRPGLKPKEKMQKWIDENPNAYLHMTLTAIAAAADTSLGTVNRYLIETIAERDGILPSQVVAKRESAGYKRSPMTVSDGDQKEILRLHYEGYSDRDIRHIMGYSLPTIGKIIKKANSTETRTTK